MMTKASDKDAAVDAVATAGSAQGVDRRAGGGDQRAPDQRGAAAISQTQALGATTPTAWWQGLRGRQAVAHCTEPEAGDTSADQGLRRRAVAVVPAAGVGSRFGAATPKQYLDLDGQAVLQRAVAALRDAQGVAGVLVVLSAGDPYFAELPIAADPAVLALPIGGASRRDSVLAGLTWLQQQGLEADCPVLVHDAARPGLTPTLVDQLLLAVAGYADGGLLAMPIADTLKLADAAQQVERTVPRDGLWSAQTPQAFELGLLQRCLLQAPDATDEASAVERFGHRPKLVPGAWRNMKLTHPADLDLLRRLLA